MRPFVALLLCLTPLACGGGETLEQPVADPAAAARAFRLLYAERVERAVIAFNRFQIYGDPTFGMNVGKFGVARTGDEFEVIPGPNDNNNIGLSTWTTWHAYRALRTRTLGLSLVRMFNGLTFLAEASGHQGVTSRHAGPGWTFVADGATGTVSRSRNGSPVAHPWTIDPDLEREMVRAFFDGIRYTSRGEPEDTMFSYMPAVEPGPYSVTYSFGMLPAYIRISDCCATYRRTPAPYRWEGAYWSAHNSRDNFPDLSLGYLAALEARDAAADPEVREAAGRAWAAGNTVGDLVQSHGGRLMTVGEFTPYDQLVVAGGFRPDGETESEDLGSLSDCATAYLARALSTPGLSLPLPELPLPGSIDPLLDEVFAECTPPPADQTCHTLDATWCGSTYATVGGLHFFGEEWLALALRADERNPGTAETLIGSFQDDYYEKTLAMLGVVEYARVSGDAALLAEARRGVADMTGLMRRFADIIWQRTAPERRTDRYYEAALFEAWAGIGQRVEDLADLERAESRLAAIEGWLDQPDTEAWPLLSDEELKERAESQRAAKSETVKARYRAAYGEQPPVRRAGDGYEARTFHPDTGLSAWHPVERPRHRIIGHVRLLETAPLCRSAPGYIDCTWARAGCRRADLDRSGSVDAADRTAFDEQRARRSTGCGPGNDWCGGGDLDRTGAVDATDEAFLQAASGCWYAPPAGG